MTFLQGSVSSSFTYHFDRVTWHLHVLHVPFDLLLETVRHLLLVRDHNVRTSVYTSRQAVWMTATAPAAAIYHDLIVSVLLAPAVTVSERITWQQRGGGGKREGGARLLVFIWQTPNDEQSWIWKPFSLFKKRRKNRRKEKNSLENMAFQKKKKNINFTLQKNNTK